MLWTETNLVHLVENVGLAVVFFFLSLSLEKNISEVFCNKNKAQVLAVCSK